MCGTHHYRVGTLLLLGFSSKVRALTRSIALHASIPSLRCAAELAEAMLMFLEDTLEAGRA